MSENHSTQAKAQITLGLLNAVHEDSQLTQRSVANELDIALGLVNAYLKRCAKKGFIKVRQIPKNRYAYYLTPTGFAEKSRLTAEFLSQSLSLFRQARQQYKELLEQCAENNRTRIVLYGESDLSEIVSLCVQDCPVSIVAIVKIGATDDPDSRPPILSNFHTLEDIDAIIITNIEDPQGSFDVLINEFPSEKILTPEFLDISRAPQSNDIRFLP